MFKVKILKFGLKIQINKVFKELIIFIFFFCDFKKNLNFRIIYKEWPELNKKNYIRQ